MDSEKDMQIFVHVQVFKGQRVYSFHTTFKATHDQNFKIKILREKYNCWE